MAYKFPATRGLREMALCLVLGLSACAGDIAKPTIVQDMTAAQRNDIKVTSITTAKGPGVAATPEELTRIAALIRAEMEARSPSHILPDGSPDGALVAVTLTS